MAKKKRRRRTSLLTKAINWGILGLAFARPVQLALKGEFNTIQFEATGGLVNPGGAGFFDKNAIARFYGPMVAAIVLKKAISMVRRTARV